MRIPMVVRSNLYNDPLRVPADIATSHPLCVNCRYYLPPNLYGLNIQDKKKGFCGRSGMIHVVDGSVEYESVERYRQFTCKGQLYEPIPLEGEVEEKFIV